jgi:hypothetical protein
MRRRRRSINPDASAQRTALRSLGVVLTVVGAGFTAVGMISFFSAFSSHESPSYFWCAFVGLPLLGFGTSLLKYGYLGAASRYVAGEVAPVATDTAKYVADEVAGSVRKLAAAARGREAGTDDAIIGSHCSACGAEQHTSSRFCDQCGVDLTSASRVCRSCRGDNEADARFCRHCGMAMA